MCRSPSDRWSASSGMACATRRRQASSCGRSPRCLMHCLRCRAPGARSSSSLRATTSARSARSRCRCCLPSCASSTTVSSPYASRSCPPRSKTTAAAAEPGRPVLTPEQAAAIDALASMSEPGGASVALLHGVTGSGKTEVYLRSVERALDAGKQALVLVPEINLTPQLEARFAQRFAGRRIVSLHSALTPAQRLRHLAGGAPGRRRPGARHPPGGVRAAAAARAHRRRRGARPFVQAAGRRALFGARPGGLSGRHEAVPVVLGSATPSLESWHRALHGRYRLLSLPQRIGEGALPRVRLVDMNLLPKSGGAPAALSPRIARCDRATACAW